VPSVIHGSAVIVPAAVAVAEQLGSSGAELLTAVMAGWETLVTIGLASPGGFQAAGFQTVAVAGPFGAAVAAGLLRGLDESTLTAALGICGSQSSGTFAFLSNGSSVKALHAGWAAHSGVLATELAGAGVTGPELVFEDRFGLFAVYTRDSQAADRFAGLLPRLGLDWALPSAAFKRFPVCHYIHPFLEAAEQLRDDGVRAEEIETLRCRVPDGEAPLICEPWESKLMPRSDHEARWSLPVCLGQVLLRGRLSPADITGIAADPDVLALAARTSWERWPDSGFPYRFPAQLTVTTTSGRELTADVEDVRGSAARPIAPDEVRKKFLANAGPVLGDAAAAHVVATVDDLSALGDVRELTELLRTGRRCPPTGTDRDDGRRSGRRGVPTGGRVSSGPAPGLG
jgi:2-methylcitrate dehydratase PrpD